MKILKRVLVLSVAALVSFGAISADVQAAQGRGGYSARTGGGQQGQNRAHRAPVQRFNRGGHGFYRGGRGINRGGRGFNRGGRGFNRGGRGFNRGGRGFNRGGRGFNRGGRGFNRGGRGFNRRGHGFNRGGRGFNRGGHGFYRGGHRGYYYPGYVGCQPTFSFFYDSYGNRIRLHGGTCF